MGYFGPILLKFIIIIFFQTYPNGVLSSSRKQLDLHGVPLQFVIFHNPPYDMLYKDSNGTYRVYGATYNSWLWLSVKFNFTYTQTVVNQTLVEKYGTHEASFYQLINDPNIDGIVCPFILTPDRNDRMDSTSNLWAEGFNLIVPNEGEESRLFAFIKPFQYTVWLFLLISMVAIIGFMTLFMWFTNNIEFNSTIKQSKRLSSIISTTTIYIVGSLTNQGNSREDGRFSFRLLAGFWLLGSMVLVYSYSSIVTSSLTVPQMKPTIDSLEDLAARKDVGIVLRHEMVMGERILKGTSGVYKALGDKARANPQQIVGDPFKFTTMMETGRYAYPMIKTFCAYFIASEYKKDGRCRFKLSRQLKEAPGYYSMLMKKRSPYVREFSHGVMKLWESGLVGTWVYNNVPKADQCFTSQRRRNSNDARQVAIKLYDLTSAFLIFGIGLGLSSVCFLFELVHHRIKRCFKRIL